MRKIILTVIIFFLALNIYAQRKNFGRWSFYPEYGYNLLDGDINQNLTAIFPASLRDITYGVGLEYALTPVWGLSLDYFYFPMKANNTVPLVNIDTKLHSADLNATINFTRLIYPETKSRFHLNGSIGVGFAEYYTNPTNPLTGLIHSDAMYNEDSVRMFRAGSVPVSFSLEYNFAKAMALGVRIQYRAYTRDNLEGVSYLNWKGVTNDYIAAGSIYLRFKFGSIKKTHMRDARWQDYEPAPGLIEAREAKKQLADLASRVDAIDNRLKQNENNVDSLGKRLGNVEQRMNRYDVTIQNMENFMSNNGPDTDGDGVPDSRDKEPNTPENTEVDFWGVSLKPSPAKKEGTGIDIYNDLIPAVYFDFDKTDLDNQALETISKVATKMLSDSTLLVVIKGYADNPGKDNYNIKLSQRRAERVKKELVKVWGVNQVRIQTIGNGSDKNTKIIFPYRPSRRCDFYFSK